MICYELILWNNCTMNCEFCNLHNKHQSTKEEQIASLESIDRFIDKLTSKYSVLFIGGEIFNGLDEEIEELLFNLYKKVVVNPDVKTIYFNTNLLYKISETGLLYRVLSLAEVHNRLKNIHFTTSDDHSGRWKNDDQRELFYKNILWLRDRFRDMPIIVNTIMTKDLVNPSSYYNIQVYMNALDVKVNLLPYININNKPEFLPTRDEYIQFILKQKEYSPDYMDSWIDMWSHDREVEVRQYNPKTEKLEDLTETEKPCGIHNANFSNCFADSDECFLCFLENFK